MTGYTFNQLFDFTRTTSATFVGSNGLIQTTPASVNLLTYTQEFDNAAWTKSNATVTANSTTAPDGTTTADTLVPSNGVADGNIQQIVSGASAGAAYSVSYYVKAAGFSTIRLRLAARTAGNVFISEMQVDANLSAGTVGAVSAGTFTSTAASITDAGNGWYRVSLSGVTPATTGILWASLRYSSAGDGVSGFFIWGAQLELGASATTYTRNNGGVYPARFDYNPVTLAPKGILIEEQRTNLLVYSEQFDNAGWSKVNCTVTTNATTSPDGTTNAEKLIVTNALNTGNVVQIPTLAASTAYTETVFAKKGEWNWVALETRGEVGDVLVAWFNLDTGVVGTVNVGATATITNFGNGWYRCSLTRTTGATTTSPRARVYATNADAVFSTGDGTSGIFIWGAQLEAGAFPTSYIPTVASQVTRTADVCTITAPMFAPWYNQSEGTFVVSCSMLALNPVTTQELLQTDDGSSTNTIILRANNTGNQTSSTATTGGVSQGFIDIVGAEAGVTQNIALAVKINDTAMVRNGGAVSSDTSYSVPTSQTRVFIGTRNSGFASINGHIRSVKYYPFRASNNQLQALST